MKNIYKRRTSGSILTSGKLFFTKKIPSRQARGFTMMELIFVIVIMGLLSTFGVEFMAQAYKGFIYSKINNSLQNESATTVEFIAKRLSYRIKDSVIARKADRTFTSVQNASGNTYTTLEWIGIDIDGLRGDRLPLWSGIIDLDDGNRTNIRSLETNTTLVDTLIRVLSDNNTTIADSAIYFIGSNSDVNSSYGWIDGSGGVADQMTAATHPVTTGINLTDFSSRMGVDFNNTDIYEYYKLAWTAYALELATDGNLTLHYNYQPWNGDDFLVAKTKSVLLMQNVSTFQFRAVGSLLKIQICVESTLTGEEYSICKEKTIY